MFGKTQYVPGPCPNCGEPGGAIMGRTLWGHNALCCSNECGFAYYGSERRREREHERALLVLEQAKREVRRWAPDNASEIAGRVLEADRLRAVAAKAAG